MGCGYSVKAANLILILLVILSIGKFFVSDTKANLVMNLIVAAAGIELLFVPQIGRCQLATMTCNARTFPVIDIGALLLLLVAVITMIFGAAELLGNRRSNHADSQ